MRSTRDPKRLNNCPPQRSTAREFVEDRTAALAKFDAVAASLEAAASGD